MTVAPDLRALAKAGPVHFMGVGGAGMLALAELLARKGLAVTGCDAKRTQGVADLERLGVTVWTGHGPEHVEGAAAVVVTSAVPADHPELVRARSLEIPVVKRAAALGSWVAGGTVVGIAGTHGKTTTTAMTTEILAHAGREPTGLVGGRVTGWNGNLRPGSDKLFVVEADEYDRSFLTLHPDVAVVTNLEADHLDIYGNLAGVRDGFRSFLRGLKAGGRVVVCADDPGASSLLPEFAAAGYTYGLRPAPCSAPRTSGWSTAGPGASSSTRGAAGVRWICRWPAGTTCSTPWAPHRPRFFWASRGRTSRRPCPGSGGSAAGSSASARSTASP
jgi:UDP-N-acetylmuramate-alanine ligase